GFLAIANTHMAEAIKKISIQRGHDPKDYVLCAFGGAGGQHACAVADAVGVRTILLHPLAGLLSAWGLNLAELRSVRETTVERALAACKDLEARAENITTEAHAALAAQGARRITTSVSVHLKYEGTDVALPVPFAGPAALAAAFAAEHQKRFGFT